MTKEKRTENIQHALYVTLVLTADYACPFSKPLHITSVYHWPKCKFIRNQVISFAKVRTVVHHSNWREISLLDSQRDVMTLGRAERHSKMKWLPGLNCVGKITLSRRHRKPPGRIKTNWRVHTLVRPANWNLGLYIRTKTVSEVFRQLLGHYFLTELCHHINCIYCNRKPRRQVRERPMTTIYQCLI